MPAPRAMLKLLAVAALATTIANCSDSLPLLPTPSPTASPTTGSPVVAVNLTVAGPARLAPGATAKYVATASFSDGTFADVTQNTAWQATSVPLWITMTPDGTATALTRGSPDVIATYGRLTRYFRVIVAEEGIYRLVGSVLDSETGQPIAVATVEVEDALGAKQETGTDIGDVGFPYILFLPPGRATLRVSSTGYLSSTETVELTSDTLRDFRIVRRR